MDLFMAFQGIANQEGVVSRRGSSREDITTLHSVEALVAVAALEIALRHVAT